MGTPKVACRNFTEVQYRFELSFTHRTPNSIRRNDCQRNKSNAVECKRCWQVFGWRICPELCEEIKYGNLAIENIIYKYICIKIPFPVKYLVYYWKSKGLLTFNRVYFHRNIITQLSCTDYQHQIYLYSTISFILEG